MAVPLSSADAAVIEHHVPLDEAAVKATAAHSHVSIEHLYDVDATAEALVYVPGSSEKIEPPFERVALQFPDEALVDSVPLFHALNDALWRLDVDRAPSLYILADTSYGSCCVDEVAAAHVDADVVVHYGHACLTPTAKLPALYVFPKSDVEVSRAVEGLELAASHLSGSSDVVCLTYDVAYEHMIDRVYASLASRWRSSKPLTLARVDARREYARYVRRRSERTKTELDSHERTDDARRACGQCGKCTGRAQEADGNAVRPQFGTARSLRLPEGVSMSQTATLYLGGESRALTHMLLALGPAYEVASYDPQSDRARAETGRTNRLLMRRYALVQKARDASVVGLVVGTLGVHNYLPLLQRLRKLLTSPASQRKVYTISVGKLNPAKLANFQEIDVFVLVACPENSLLDTRDFQKPIVTPWEMLLAVQAHGGREVDWTGEYTLGLSHVVERSADVPQDTDAQSDDTPHYSFATGSYVSRTRYGRDADDRTDVESSAALERVRLEPHQVAVRNPRSGQLTRVLETASKAHLQDRAWTGLDTSEGAHRPHAVLEQGLAGFAQRYEAQDGVREGGTDQ